MSHKAVLFLGVFLSFSLGCPQSHALDLKLVDGKIIENVEIKGVSGGKVKWSNASGLGNTPVSQLSDESLAALGLAMPSTTSEEDKKKRLRLQNFDALRKEARDITLTNFTKVNSGQFKSINDLSIALINDSGTTNISLALFPDDVLQLLQWTRDEIDAAQKKEEGRIWAAAEMQREWHRREELQKLIKESKDKTMIDLASWYTNVFQEKDAHLFASPGDTPILENDSGDGSSIAKAKDAGYASIGYLSFSQEGREVDPQYFETIGKVVGADRIIVFIGQKDRDRVVRVTKTLYPGQKETTTNTNTSTVGGGTVISDTGGTAVTTVKDPNDEKVGSAKTQVDGQTVTNVQTVQTTNQTRTVVTREGATRTVEDAVIKITDYQYDVVYLRKLRR